MESLFQLTPIIDMPSIVKWNTQNINNMNGVELNPKKVFVFDKETEERIYG